MVIEAFTRMYASVESGVLSLVDWFHREMGVPGLVLLCGFVIAITLAVFRRQIEKAGTAKVAKVYLPALLLLAAFHWLMPAQSAEQTAVSVKSRKAIQAGSQAGPSATDRSAKWEELQQRLDQPRRERALRQRPREDENSRAKLGPEELAQAVVENDVDWVRDIAVPVASWAVVICLALYLLRAHPNLLRPSELKRLFTSSKWIRPERSKSNELGSNDFATPKQIKRWITPHDHYDTKLPVTDLRGSSGIVVRSGTLHIPRGERNRHVLIVAKTGSGKTTKLILPILYNDCLCPHRSTIIIDSKQEMWHKLASMTRKHNPEKNLLLFNPLDRIRSLSWNILAKVESDTDCKLIANSVIMATDEPQSKQDSPFFRNSALQILNAVMVGLMHDGGERLSMPRIHELISKGMHGLCDWLEAHPEAIRTTRAFVELARSGSQNADTIMSELSMRLQAWDLLAIRSTTFYDEIDIERVIKEPTLFVIELRESELKMLRPMANVIVVELLRYLTKYAEECPGQSLPRPVGLVIDEFASALGRLPDIHIKLNTLRSRNVSVVAAIQSIGQIKGNYGEDWESVLSGFSTKIFMPSLDYVDSEWASKESGVMTIRYKTNSKGTNRKITENFSHNNSSLNEQIQQRQVLTPGEVGRPADNQATFFMPETPVFQGHLTPYYKVPEMVKHLSSDADEDELKLRDGPIEYEEELPEPIIRTGIDPQNGAVPGQPVADAMADPQVWAALEEIKVGSLDWNNTVGDARKWWEAFEEENKTRIALVLKVAQEIVKRGATITDFFLAYVYSNTDNIQATLAYLDYTMHMKNAEVETAYR